MARVKTFDVDEALGAAIGVFREHGYEGTSAQMLVDAMGIGRQSLYDTFGDKWQLYQAALKRYETDENRAHLAALASGPRAIDGLHAMIRRVIEHASAPCLGVGSVVEFGCSRPELMQIHASADRALRGPLKNRIREAQTDGDIAADLAPDVLAGYLLSNIAGLRIAARGGAKPAQLQALAQVIFRALA